MRGEYFILQAPQDYRGGLGGGSLVLGGWQSPGMPGIGGISGDTTVLG